MWLVVKITVSATFTFWISSLIQVTGLNSQSFPFHRFVFLSPAIWWSGEWATDPDADMDPGNTQALSLSAMDPLVYVVCAILTLFLLGILTFVHKFKKKGRLLLQNLLYLSFVSFFSQLLPMALWALSLSPTRAVKNDEAQAQHMPGPW